MNIAKTIVVEQRNFFRQNKTKSMRERLMALTKLKGHIQAQEEEIITALKQDFGKPPFESYVNEILGVIREINYYQKHLKEWSRSRRVGTNLMVFPASAQLRPEPLGVVLIISPWNYPFYLCLMPLIGAIAAGNCVVIKPSEYTPATSAVIAQLIESVFPPSWATVLEGDETISQQLLQEKFDHIFFTGSPRVGRLIMAAAADNLTPVTLELGGKSPCVVDREINLQETAKRIIWGKLVNAGQTCVAPDYLLVEQSCLEQLLPALQQAIKTLFGENPAHSPDYTRIVNQRQWSRLVSLLSHGKVFTGGEHNEGDRYIAPTLIIDPDLNSPLMQGEIFGPILPILTYQSLSEAIDFINTKPKPLALYFFSNNGQKQEQILQSTSSGSVCFNDILLHLTVADLPFGGVGESGMGRYHGKATFDTFSNYKSILRRPFWGETNLRYPPYGKKMNLIKKLFS
ncbi:MULTISPECIES: aldehyde dehydrogenase family protein [unclassified Synechocystis]|uniref:aldehyde dehydrogenase family protein n=1 Tax=unclassified Synechocystis TaxID=2640012 RepID=UPI000420B9CF|nr:MULTISPECIES: aldehyde dehydrogenase family protein [unclassified Synechocystis]AIE74710.1 Aldehyde dehydrogenase [Synechocystis sp. PCC 6714]MCT0253937.1 aldehyde dehydrogenase family protein [Synechocystis sp. CS-94]